MKNIKINEAFYHLINLLVGAAVYNKYDLKAAALVVSAITFTDPLYDLSLGLNYERTNNWENLRQKLWNNKDLCKLRKNYSGNKLISVSLCGYKLLADALYFAVPNCVIQKYLINTCLDYVKILISNDSFAKVTALALISPYIIMNLNPSNYDLIKRSISICYELLLNDCFKHYQLNLLRFYGLNLLSNIIYWSISRTLEKTDIDNKSQNYSIKFFINNALTTACFIIPKALINSDYIGLDKSGFAIYFAEALLTKRNSRFVLFNMCYELMTSKQSS